MNINSIFNKTFDFIIRRTAELIGILLILISIFLFISLSSYSPDDPNFIFSRNVEIKNIFGFEEDRIIWNKKNRSKRPLI